MEQLELVVDAKAALGEGPSWDAVNNRLYWVDIIGKKLHWFDPATGTDNSVQYEQSIGTVVPRAAGGVALALHHGFYTTDDKFGNLTLIVDPESHLPNTRFNDGKCDAAGRFWAGTMSLHDESGAGTLYRLDADGSVHAMVGNVSISNGLGWSPDQNTMYFIDSAARNVVAYDFDLASGAIANGRTIIEFSESDGLPDGMTVDAEGNLWIAQWEGYQVSRWNPTTGERLEVVPVPAKFITSCVFGGERLDELYITTAREGMTEQELAQYPHAGGVFRLRTNVKGTESYAFQG